MAFRLPMTYADVGLLSCHETDRNYLQTMFGKGTFLNEEMRDSLSILREPPTVVSSSDILVPHFVVKYRPSDPLSVADTDRQLKSALAATLDQAILLAADRDTYASYGAMVSPKEGTVTLYAMVQTQNLVCTTLHCLLFLY